ncbi:MAG: hypothetical protein MHM6MM_007175 [Cercozoa sp. M6MM]
MDDLSKWIEPLCALVGRIGEIPCPMPLRRRGARLVSLPDFLAHWNPRARDRFGALCELLREAHACDELSLEAAQQTMSVSSGVVAALLATETNYSSDAEIDHGKLIRAVVLLADRLSQQTPSRSRPRGWHIVPTVATVTSANSEQRKFVFDDLFRVEAFDFSEVFAPPLNSDDAAADRVMQVNFELKQLARKPTAEMNDSLLSTLEKLANCACDIICAQEIPAAFSIAGNKFTSTDGEEWHVRLYDMGFHGKRAGHLADVTDDNVTKGGAIYERALCAVRTSAYSFLDSEEEELRKNPSVAPLAAFLPAEKRGVADVFLRRRNNSVLHFGIMHAPSSNNKWLTQLKTIDAVLGATSWHSDSAWSELCYAFIVGDLNTKLGPNNENEGTIEDRLASMSLDSTDSTGGTHLISYYSQSHARVKNTAAARVGDSPNGDFYLAEEFDVDNTLRATRLCNRRMDSMQTNRGGFIDQFGTGRCYDQMLVPHWSPRVTLWMPLTQLIDSDHLPVCYTVPIAPIGSVATDSATRMTSTSHSDTWHSATPCHTIDDRTDTQKHRILGETKILRHVLSQRYSVPPELLDFRDKASTPEVALAHLQGIVDGIAFLQSRSLSL